MEMFFNQAGQSISLEAWANAFLDYEVRRLRLDSLKHKGEAIEVSTVWVGIDMNFTMRPGLPLIFETLVSGGPWDGDTLRYATRDDAIEGHQVMAETILQQLQES